MKFKLYVILLIFISCSKESVDEFDNLNNNDSDYNMVWQSGTSYETTIQIGETITWTWGGGTHNLRSTGGVETFDSGCTLQPMALVFLIHLQKLA